MGWGVGGGGGGGGGGSLGMLCKSKQIFQFRVCIQYSGHPCCTWAISLNIGMSTP